MFDDLENDLAGIIGIILFLLIAYLLWLSWDLWKKASFPGWAYPDQLWGDLSTVVDSDLSANGLEGSSLKGAVDRGLGGVFGWIVNTFPSVPAAKNQASGNDPSEAFAGGA